MEKGIHYLQVVDDRPQMPLRKKCMDSVKALVREGVDGYEIVQIPWSDDPFQRVMMAEKVRFDRAKRIPNLCYIDTDCFIHEGFVPPNDGKPYFAEYSYNYSDPGIPDIYYFFVNGCCEFFQRNFSQPHNSNQKYSVDMQILRGLTNFGLIPDSSFVHCYSTMNIVYNQSHQEPTGFTVDELELTSLKKSVELMVLNMRAFDELRRKQDG